MNEDDLLFIQEEFRGFITASTFTREDLRNARKTLEEARLNKTVCRALLALISMVRTELREVGLKAREECFRECMETAIRIVEASGSGNVTVDVDASSKSASGASSHSEMTGKKMGDEISIGGDAINSAVGSAAKFKARDVASYKQTVDSSLIDDELKAILVKAREALDSAELPPGDAEDTADDLAKLTAEMEKPEKDAGRIRKLWGRIRDAAPTVASILASAASIAKLLGGEQP